MHIKKNHAHLADSAFTASTVDSILLKKRVFICFKRFYDVCGALLGLLICSPLFAIVVLLIKATSVGQVFFKQVRVGKNGSEFRIYKFRTMIENAEHFGEQITVNGDVRITKIGHILRKTKVDELPQLINVLRGEMSFVGPRPEVPKYVVLYSSIQREILKIRPGITDLASIRFCNENELLAVSDNPLETYVRDIMPEKLALNREYIMHMSFFFDIKIICMTLQRIIQ